MDTPPNTGSPSTEDHAASTPNISFRELRVGDDTTAFRTLNEEWISEHFVLEDEDREQLGHPEIILNQGGHIFLVLRDGESVGCAALVPMAAGVYQLSKMAVAPQVRGLGIGRSLALHLIDQARTLGAQSLFLGSNTKLVNAVKLYESVGFRHVGPDEIPQLPYNRVDVFMKLDLW